MGDTPIWIVAPEDLIISKLEWAREISSSTQLGDIRNLLGALKNLDKDYLAKWIDRLQLKQIYEKANLYA